MQEARKPSQSNIIAAILFAVLALRQLTFIFRFFSVISLLWLLALAGAAVLLFMKRRDILTVAVFGVMAVLSLIGFIMGFGRGYYASYRHLVNIFNMIPYILRFAAYLAALALTGAALTDAFPQFRELAKKVWFAPAALIAAAYIVAFFLFIINRWFGLWMNPAGFLSGFFWDLLLAGGLSLASLWALAPEGIPAKESSYAGAAYTQTAHTGSTPPYNPANFYYCGLVKHILLLLFTFGIWQLIWIYRVTEYLNRTEGEPYRSPTSKLLLCMFVPFYGIYWTYKSALLLDKLAYSRGVSSDLGVLCLVLSLFVPIVPPVLIQDKINAVVTAEGAGSYAPPRQTYAAPGQQTYTAPQEPAYTAPAQPEEPAPQEPAAPVQPEAPAPAEPHAEPSVVSEIKAYKELLDSGAITQEEFDAMKKKLLGL